MVRVSVCKEGGVAVEESLVIDDPEVLAHERVRLIQLDIGRLLPPLVKREIALRVNPITISNASGTLRKKTLPAFRLL